MNYNLLEESWIPIRRASGKVEHIAPWQICETSDPPLRIESPRPDFDAALLEFLIGLVQMVFTPENSTHWEEVYEDGCTPKILKEKMLTERDAFFLGGEGPRFMQDLTVHLDNGAKIEPIEGLLIDRATNDDSGLFAKSGGFEELGLPAAAAAILTLQIFAPSGGQGHRTSLRGGGPLSVTVKDKTLWRTVWCNILIRSDVEGLPGDCNKTSPADRMPWMGHTRTSEQGSKTLGTFPEHVHPLQHFWGLPRRFRLIIDSNVTGTCSIYGDQDVIVVRTFHSKNYGTNYDGPYRHPLTPYTQGQNGKPPNSKKSNKNGLPYRDWPLLTVGSETGLPPKAVDAFFQQERWRYADCHSVVARGYAVKNMKPLLFIESEAPLLHVPRAILDEVRADAGALVAASESVRSTLSVSVKAAWSDRPGDRPGEVEARVDTAFWASSESAFHAALRRITLALENEKVDEVTGVKRDFLRSLQHVAFQVFDSLCPLDVEEGPGCLARAVHARRDLDRYTNPTGISLLRCVGLATAGDAPPKSKRSSKRKEPIE